MNRAEQANRLLNDPLLKESFSAVKASIQNKIASTPRDGKPDTDRYLEKCCDMLAALELVHRFLAQQIDLGKLREDEIRKRPRWGGKGLS